MKTIFKSIALASLGLAMLAGCTKNETIDGTASGDRLMELSVTGVLGEYKAVGDTKASLVNTPRVGWSGNETVHVFQQSDGKYLGFLTSSVKSSGVSVATLGGTINSGTGTLVFVYTNVTGLSPTAGDKYTNLEISLASQGADTPFVVYGTADSPGTETVSGLVVNFSFATSVVSTYAAGLPANSEVTRAALDGINTNCVLGISTLDVSGSESGIITKNAGIESTNSEGQVLFEIAVPVSGAASSDRSIEFTIDTETYTAAFSNAAIAAGRAYSTMSENHSVEDLDYVEMKMGSDQSKTLKWKKMNLGATTVAGSGKTCYGDYYAWGETRPYYETKTWNDTDKTWIFETWYPYKSDGYAKKTYCNGSTSFSEWDPAPYDGTTKNLKPEYDVVQQKVGNGWRMPTSQEFKDLADACGGSSNFDKDTYKSPATCGEATTFSMGIYWCDNYDGVAGCLFCDGTNRLFFPAAGYGTGTNLSAAGIYGFYWFSTLKSSDSAFRLRFYSTNVEPQQDGIRVFGHSVRPVSD